MKTITVHAPEHLSLEACQKVLASVLNRVGHPGCYSGFNISFVNAVDPAQHVFIVEKEQIIGH